MGPAANSNASSWIWWLILPFLGWLLFTQIRYWVQRYSSAGWPTIEATIQKGPTGFLPIRGASGTTQGMPACFLGYVFRVSGSTYTGLFALYGRSDDVERVHRKFSSGSIRIRYKPANPEISLLDDLNDPRFERLTSTQNPQHLTQAPSFDLQDVIRN